MKKHKFLIITMLIILITAFIIFIFLYKSKTPYNLTGPTECMTDSDCQVYGVSGECDCGCYNNTYQPEQKNGGLCFCAAPNSCKCENNKCEGVYN